MYLSDYAKKCLDKGLKYLQSKNEKEQKMIIATLKIAIFMKLDRSTLWTIYDGRPNTQDIRCICGTNKCGTCMLGRNNLCLYNFYSSALISCISRDNTDYENNKICYTSDALKYVIDYYIFMLYSIKKGKRIDI